MAIFKCKMCGGSLEINDNATVCECEYCGTKQTVPNADNDKKVSAFNRANKLRLANEFDKAAGVYESIVAEYEEEAEAYWGLCLCKYGIEYVDDPATGKKIPTCHRTQFTSVFEDSDFELALENADSVAVSVYREEAKEIDRLQKAILDIANKEEPFDIFICYKETAEDGQRTKDSVLAQDMYDKLTEKGYKVFFARITLEDKLGQEYEPYIFSALNSAKIMLAVGTKYEYYNAVWVKNEWSRFLDMMKKDKEKVLIPCYADIDAYDMPQEFKNLQGQDMGKVGFMQDLVRGIGKIIPLEEVKPVVVAPVQNVVQQVGSNSNVENLIKRGYIALEDEKWIEADNFFDRVLDINAEEPMAYIGKILVHLKINSITDYTDNYSKLTPLSDFSDYQKAYRFANDSVKEELDEWNNKHMYNVAIMYLNNSSDETDCAYARGIFEKIKDYKDSEQKIIECDIKADEHNYRYAISIMAKASNDTDYGKAKKIFERIKHYKDSVQKIVECDERAIESIYNYGIHQLYREDNIKNYNLAIGAFDRIPDYKDSKEKLEECKQKIHAYTQNVMENKYKQATKAFNEAKTVEGYWNAKALFNEIRDYKDSQKKIEQCLEQVNKIKKHNADTNAYNKATQLANNAKEPKQYVDAAEILISTGREEYIMLADEYRLKAKKLAKKITLQDNAWIISFGVNVFLVAIVFLVIELLLPHIGDTEGETALLFGAAAIALICVPFLVVRVEEFEEIWYTILFDIAAVIGYIIYFWSKVDIRYSAMKLEYSCYLFLSFVVAAVITLILTKIVLFIKNLF